MHDIWNPWHGCIKKSEGCQHCYMYFLDKPRGKDGDLIYKVKNNFYYPLAKEKKGIFAAPFIEPISLKDYLPCGQIEQVVAGGENYNGDRPCHYEWVKLLYDECVANKYYFALWRQEHLLLKRQNLSFSIKKPPEPYGI